MKMKLLTIGLLSAALAATTVFADNTGASTQGNAPTMNNQQQAANAPMDANNAATAPAMPQTDNKNGQTSAQ
ncbi:MAG TPA: hypothetical protein VLJ15_09250 [Gammaproteobacteria bacterium]|nr:hypothetical protein [Gammaproteobacteria bacterium]